MTQGISILVVVEPSLTTLQGHSYLQHAQLCGILSAKVLHTGEC